MNENKNNENDFTSDAAFEHFCDMARHELMRDKTLILLPDAMERTAKVADRIKRLLKAEYIDEYTMAFEQHQLHPTTLVITIETDTFGTSEKHHSIFKEIINEIDSFDSIWLTSGKMRISFGLSNVYQEI